MTLYNLFQKRATEQPGSDAIVWGESRITYAELDAQVRRIAGQLHARGIRPGDCVLLLAGNHPDAVAIYLAVSRLGAVYAPVSTGFRAREGQFILSNALPKLAIVGTEHLSELRSWQGAAELDVVTLGEDAVAGFTRFEDLAGGDQAVPEYDVPDEAPLLLSYTSGTTSTPKPVLHSQRSEKYNAQTYAQAWDLVPEDRGLVFLPLAWVYGLSTTTAALLVSGACVVLLPRFHPVDVLDAVAHHRITAIWGTMSMYTKLLEVIKERDAVDLSSIRFACNGGEPCPPPLVQAFEDRTGVTLLGSYATSEARPMLVVRPDDVDVPEGTVGRLVPGAEIKLLGEDGSEILGDQPGLALLRCGGMMTGYHRNPELTAAHITPDGWLRTGDLLRRDSRGFFFVLGRESEMIIRSGVNIAPAEVEAALTALPAVADAAVVGVADPRSGQAVRAFVVLEKGAEATTDEIVAALREQLAPYKIPKDIIFLPELPRTERGKLDRALLKAAPVEAEKAGKVGA